MKLFDAHCHVASLDAIFGLKWLIEDSSAHGIEGFISTALTNEEIDWHCHNPNPAIIWGAGMHPNFPDCDITLETLQLLADKGRLAFIGEIGLDRNKQNVELQIQDFRQQLQLAQKYDLPVILHLVGHIDQAVKLMQAYKLKYMVHSYAGSVEGFEQLLKLGCCFTISSRLIKPDKYKLLQSMVESGKYLFETDMIKYYLDNETDNPFLILIDLLTKTQAITHIEKDILLQTQWQNLTWFFNRLELN